MMRAYQGWRLWMAAVVLCAAAVAGQPSTSKPSSSDSAELARDDFNQLVRPILSAHCFKCHGPDSTARKAGLRLDRRETATATLESGSVAIVPGKPEASEVVRRIFAADESVRMPPASANKPLSGEQKQILRRWIAQGAEYRPHWAFVPPKPSPLPKIKQADWPRNAIDDYILARLEAAGLPASPQADPYTLVRRVYLDM